MTYRPTTLRQGTFLPRVRLLTCQLRQKLADGSHSLYWKPLTLLEATPSFVGEGGARVKSMLVHKHIPITHMYIVHTVCVRCVCVCLRGFWVHILRRIWNACRKDTKVYPGRLFNQVSKNNFWQSLKCVHHFGTYSGTYFGTYFGTYSGKVSLGIVAQLGLI